MCLFKSICVKMLERRDRWNLEILVITWRKQSATRFTSLRIFLSHQWKINVKMCTVETFQYFFSLSFCLKILDTTLWSRALISVSEYLGPFVWWEWSSLVWFPGFSPVSPVRGCLSDDAWNPPPVLTDARTKTPVEVPSWWRQVALHSLSAWMRLV